jgi:hypothetical protein
VISESGLSRAGPPFALFLVYAASASEAFLGCIRVEVVVRLGGCPDVHAIVRACLPSISPSTILFYVHHITIVSVTRRGVSVEIVYRNHSSLFGVSGSFRKEERWSGDLFGWDCSLCL